MHERLDVEFSEPTDAPVQHTRGLDQRLDRTSEYWEELNQDLTVLRLPARPPSDILPWMDNLAPDGLAIPDEKRGDSDSLRGWHGRLSGCFAYASLASLLLLWVALALYHLQSNLRFSLPGWKWFSSLPGWTWPPLELFGLFLAIIAAVLHPRAKLWRIALSLSVLMFLFTMYVMGS